MTELDPMKLQRPGRGPPGWPIIGHQNMKTVPAPDVGAWSDCRVTAQVRCGTLASPEAIRAFLVRTKPPILPPARAPVRLQVERADRGTQDPRRSDAVWRAGRLPDRRSSPAFAPSGPITGVLAHGRRPEQGPARAPVSGPIVTVDVDPGRRRDRRSSPPASTAWSAAC